MKKLLPYIGRPAFWLSLPLLYFYLRWSRRTRVLIVAEGHVVLVRGWYGPPGYGLPGGGLHRGEEPAAGAIREVREETGLTLQPAQLMSLGSAVYKHRRLRYDYDMFYVELPKIIELKPPQMEISEIIWLPLEGIMANRLESDVVNTIKTWTEAQSLVK